MICLCHKLNDEFPVYNDSNVLYASLMFFQNSKELCVLIVVITMHAILVIVSG